MQPVPSAGKHATGAKRGKTCNGYQARENMQRVRKSRKIYNRCQVTENFRKRRKDRFWFRSVWLVAKKRVCSNWLDHKAQISFFLFLSFEQITDPFKTKEDTRSLISTFNQYLILWEKLSILTIQSGLATFLGWVSRTILKLHSPRNSFLKETNEKRCIFYSLDLLWISRNRLENFLLSKSTEIAISFSVINKVKKLFKKTRSKRTLLTC